MFTSLNDNLTDAIKKAGMTYCYGAKVNMALANYYINCRGIL